MSDESPGELQEAEVSPSTIDAKTLDTLASQLVWRIGRSHDDGPIIVRVGFTTQAALFAELPRLKNATDQELKAAAEEGNLRVEWVGQRSL